ncbi:hydroxyethylthiazole kinase [Streptococcus pacificus]|uniref:Hydroxyethylthiazole kinase n=1 Tax=Streptococcus pacificus TaxID=2740577 RepID=A0ABS0ZJP3_9STRE|nr:hydroxyethylthiazole kinase [Streptococcus pacificus]MBJ8326225.1 hydroxyethylthiazole kinase [Streptococcus pacificus]
MYLEELKKKNPLVICITNNVVKNFTANGLLALGASPAMSEYEEDLEDLLKNASALLVNIGTLNPEKWQAYQKAITIASANQVPVVLDPVGAGASRYRLKVSLDLLEHYPITLLRGNASEIAALIGEKQASKGVDSGYVEDIGGLARKASVHFGIPVIVTGPVDAIASNNQVRLIQNGSPLMPFVTGTGCLLGAVLAAFIGLSEEKDYLDCLSEAMLVYNIAGELAQEQTSTTGPGSFKVAFIDSLYQIETEQIKERQRITND